jgi:hypothetical protein
MEEDEANYQPQSSIVDVIPILQPTNGSTQFTPQDGKSFVILP